MAIVQALEAHFIYYPVRPLRGTPADVGLAYQEAVFPTADGVRLHGWFIPGRNAITWLWFHGNAGNISHRLENIALLHRRLGVHIFIFDYRGYGQSEGQPSEQGTYRDADAALARFALTDEERAAIKRRDVKALTALGAHPFLAFMADYNLKYET